MRLHTLKFPLSAALIFSATTLGYAARPTSVATGSDEPSAIRVLLAAQLETTLSSQMNGTLGPLHLTLGQKVSQHALLAQLSCGEVSSRAKVARAELKMARQNLSAKESLRKLDAAGDIEVANATTEVEKASGALALANTQLGYCHVAAPFSAHVAKIYVKPYQSVSVGMPLFDLVSDGPLKVRLNVPSTQLKALKAGAPLAITIHETGHTYPAHVSAINARVDAVAQTVELEAQLDRADPELIAGMTGIARFPPAAPAAPAAPVPAATP